MLDWPVFKRLLARAAERPWSRRLVAVLGAAFVIFELSRFLALIPMLSPAWDIVRGGFAGMLAMRPAAMITGLTVTALAFIIPMVGVVWAMRWLHSKLFRSETVH